MNNNRRGIKKSLYGVLEDIESTKIFSANLCGEEFLRAVKKVLKIRNLEKISPMKKAMILSRVKHFNNKMLELFPQRNRIFLIFEEYTIWEIKKTQYRIREIFNIPECEDKKHSHKKADVHQLEILFPEFSRERKKSR